MAIFGSASTRAALRKLVKITLAFVLLDEESMARAAGLPTVKDSGIESSDWPPKKGPARKPDTPMLGAVRQGVLMSAVTAVIVTTSVIEQLKETETYPAIEFINDRVREFASSGEFVEVSRWARGKHPESLIFIAGFNFCDLGLLRTVLESAPWRSPDRVQVLTRAGEALRFEFAPCKFPR